jgi:methyl-accepting chemotaxis protein
VAAEVKELAAQTAKATERVAVQIQKIQEDTGTSVTSLQSIARQINDLEITSVSIAAAVDQQSAAGQDLARSIDLAARSTELVSTSIGQVRSGALATGAAASQVLGSSSELKHQSGALRNQVDDFLNHVRQAA